MILFVALVEELLFRSLLQTALVKRDGTIIGIVVASVIFGAMSVGYGSYNEVLFATGAGIVFGFGYFKTKSLPFAVTMHGVNNIILFGVLPFVTVVPFRLV